MASYERMPINGKLRSRSKSGDPTTLPPSTVARSARATALQICGLEFHTRTKPSLLWSRIFGSDIRMIRRRAWWLRHDCRQRCRPGVLSICLTRYYHDGLTTKCHAATQWHSPALLPWWRLICSKNRSICRNWWPAGLALATLDWSKRPVWS